MEDNLIEGKYLIVNGAFEEKFFRSYVCEDKSEFNKKKWTFWIFGLSIYSRLNFVLILRKISILKKTDHLKRDLKDLIMNTKFNRQGIINKFYEYFISNKNFYIITEYFEKVCNF